MFGGVAVSAGRLLGTHRPYDLRHSDADVFRVKAVEPLLDVRAVARVVVERFAGDGAPEVLEMLGLDR